MALPKPTGDADGIEQLKAIAKDNREYFVFLINETRSNTDNTATFTGGDGVKYVLRLDVAADRLEVARAPKD